MCENIYLRSHELMVILDDNSFIEFERSYAI